MKNLFVFCLLAVLLFTVQSVTEGGGCNSNTSFNPATVQADVGKMQVFTPFDFSKCVVYFEQMTKTDRIFIDRTISPQATAYSKGSMKIDFGDISLMNNEYALNNQFYIFNDIANFYSHRTHQKPIYLFKYNYGLSSGGLSYM
jgi:hypothetical protein